MLASLPSNRRVRIQITGVGSGNILLAVPIPSNDSQNHSSSATISAPPEAVLENAC